jgi:hypothetical protein
MRLLILYVFSLLCIGATCAQDEEEDVAVLDGKPLPVLPVEQAADAISDLASEVARMSDIGQFVSGWWPVPLNNSSVLNLTA